MSGIANNLAALRRKRGISAIHLAAAAGVSRQTIYAIEAGTFVPNTTVALRLARALDTTVEDLFTLEEGESGRDLRTEEAMLVSGSGDSRTGQAVQLCRVEKRLMACAPSPVPWYLPTADAIVADRPARQGKARVQVFDAEADFGQRL